MNNIFFIRTLEDYKSLKTFFFKIMEKKSDQKGKLSWRILSQIHLCGAN